MFESSFLEISDKKSCIYSFKYVNVLFFNNIIFVQLHKINIEEIACVLIKVEVEQANLRCDQSVDYH